MVYGLRFTVLLLIVFSITLPTPVSSLEGFYEGPYLTFSGGIMQFDWDVNQNTGVEEGRTWEPILHLGFGWNVTDWLAPELNLHFYTDSNGGRREYIAGAHFGPALTLLIDPFLNFKSLRILPFVKPGFTFQAASLPGDPSANDNRLTNIGYGGGLAGGLRFLYNEYLYFGFEVQEDFIYHAAKNQLIGGAATLIYNGGFKRQFEGRAMVGVHF
ncbi:MAG: hypothetical protein HY609_05020 [Deltaproteobacteria bacterium]|nr:hypothetical protein [Deltaproteobacteria bacterium]MBI4224274.1 hypothetical protein [Deltaproteobacteria bacterium]